MIWSIGEFIFVFVDSSISNDSSVADGIETSAAIVDDNDAEDHQASLTFDGNNGQVLIRNSEYSY